MRVWRNCYRHVDCPTQPGVEWHDHWSCQCNDRCPACDREIEPYDCQPVESVSPRAPAPLYTPAQCVHCRYRVVVGGTILSAEEICSSLQGSALADAPIARAVIALLRSAAEEQRCPMAVPLDTHADGYVAADLPRTARAP